MPVKKSSIKALSVAERRATENRRWKRRLSDAIKALTKASDKDKDQAYKQVQSLVDKVVQHEIMHRNRAARLKSRLSRVAVTKS